MSDDAPAPTVPKEDSPNVEDETIGNGLTAAAPPAPPATDDANGASPDDQGDAGDAAAASTTAASTAAASTTAASTAAASTTAASTTDASTTDASTPAAPAAPAPSTDSPAEVTESETVVSEEKPATGGTPAAEPVVAGAIEKVDDVAYEKRTTGVKRPAPDSETQQGPPEADEAKTPGIAVEDLPEAVRKRMNEVLHEVEDATMRGDGRLINFLGEVAEAQALAALNEYHSAVSETSVTIRNKPAYLMGILRKYKQGQRAPVGNGMNGGVTTTPSTMGRMGAGPNGLAPSIAARLEKLYASDFIKKDDVDQRCLDFFRDLTEKEAEAAMDEFSQSDIVSIRNKSAFLMSILRKHHEARKKAGAGMYGPVGYGGAPMMSYGYNGYMDPSMAGQAPYPDYYGGAYGRPPPFYNAYGQPMAGFFPHHMPMYPPANMEVLPAAIQLRLDHLAAIGFCQPGEIDDRCRKFLREVPEHVALQSIDEFQSVDRNYIRKVSAYFMGVIRKHAEQYRASGAEAIVPTPGMPMSYDMGAKRMREAADYSFGRLSKPTGVADVMERLVTAPLKVQAGVRDLLARGVAQEWDMDVRVTNALLQARLLHNLEDVNTTDTSKESSRRDLSKTALFGVGTLLVVEQSSLESLSGGCAKTPILKLTEEQGVAAIEEFGSCDMTRIRNKSAYLMGLLKRYRTGAPPPPGLTRRQ